MGILGHSAERLGKSRRDSEGEMSVLASQDPSISAEVWTPFEQTATPVAPPENATPKPPQETSLFSSTELPPIPEWARAPAVPENPDPKRFRWDETKRAFRLIDPPARCDCAKATAAFGEKLTCGLCDGYAKQPKRFLDGPYRPTCGYCGEQVQVKPGEKRICKRCQTLKERALASGITGDDQILLAIHRALSAMDRRGRSEDEVEALHKRRKANLRRTQRRWEKRRNSKSGGQVTAAEELEAAE
jgi:hypothetical protein